MICDSPFFVDNPKAWTGEKEIPLPCGRCPPCIKRRVNGWVFRLLQEEKRSTSAYFITLTYDTDYVPITDNGFMTLSPKEYPKKKDGTYGKTKTCDLTKFFKKLRKLNKSKIVYYACGEYGGQTERPHYHAIIYNVDNVDAINTAWGLGNVHIGSVSGNSIGYTAGYINKGKIIPKHKNDDRIPEFSTMSKHIGDNYLTPEIIKYHKADVNRNYVTLEGGAKTALPKYYRDRIYNDKEKEQQRNIIVQSLSKAEKQRIEDYSKKYRNLAHKDTYEVHSDKKKIARYKQFTSNHNKSKRSKL